MSRRMPRRACDCLDWCGDDPAVQAGRLPMCEFLPVVTDSGIEGGLPKLLSGFMPADASSWLCPADQDEESTATGTSYMYLPGLLRYAPAVQVDITTLLISMGPGPAGLLGQGPHAHYVSLRRLAPAGPNTRCVGA